jgi:protein involved in polysaccharide export with SLBB domain
MKGRCSALVAVGLAVLGGCAGSRSQLHQALLADHHPAAHARDLEAQYVVRCPDVLEVQVRAMPAFSGRRTVGADGYIPLGEGKSLRAAGHTVAWIAREAARQIGVPPEQVQVRVVQHNSQHLFLIGEVDAQHQVIAYRGPETVLDLLQRVGLASGAALGDIHVVRGHVADGKPPEVFHVDLPAILLKHDQQTNIRLEPCDHIHVGERRPSRMADCVPPWLRPVYSKLWGVNETAPR